MNLFRPERFYVVTSPGWLCKWWHLKKIVVMLQTSASCVSFSGNFFRKLSLIWAEKVRAWDTDWALSQWAHRQSAWFAFTIFISLELWHFLPHSISEWGILLSWVSALGAGAFCVLLYPLGLMVSTSTCAQGPILSCCVGLCNLCIQTHTCSFTWRLHSIFWSLTAKWKGKSKVQRCKYAGNCRYGISS